MRQSNGRALLPTSRVRPRSSPLLAEIRKTRAVGTTKVNYNSCSHLSGNFRQTEVSIVLFAGQHRELGKAGRRLAGVPPAAPALAFMRDVGAA